MDASIASLLSPEARLVLLSAGGAGNRTAIEQLLEQELDWRHVAAIAQREKAWAVIGRQLAELGKQSVLEPIGPQLKQLLMVHDFKLAHLESRLWETLATLQESGIEVMVLKGAALAHLVYPSFLERPMGDIDLLVHTDSAERAWHVARSAGWQWLADEYPLQQYENHHHLPPLLDFSGPGACLEIHTAPFRPGHPFGFRSDWLWRDAQTISVRDKSALVPDWPHLLLHVCIHFAWSHRLGLGAWRTFRDVSALTEAGVIDWARFVDVARDVRAGTCAYWTLRLAHILTGAPVPMETISALRPRGSRLMLDRVERHFALSLFPPERICPGIVSRIFWERGIRPRDCGHGSIRPWRMRTPRPTGMPELPERKHEWRLWGRYVRGLFFPATTARS